MNRLQQLLILTATAVASYSEMSCAQNQDISDAADLTAVIALQGKPCGKVVNVTKRNDDDYVAACEDGNRYHVFVRDGRVIVEKID